METPGRQFERLLLALEDLIAQEELMLHAEEFAAVPPLQARAAPIIERLIALAGSVESPLRERVVALVERRGRSEEILTREMNRVREELTAMQTSRQRVAQMMPAYRQPVGDSAAGHFSARG